MMNSEDENEVRKEEEMNEEQQLLSEEVGEKQPLLSESFRVRLRRQQSVTRHPTFYRVLMGLVVTCGVAAMAVLVVYGVKQINAKEGRSKQGFYEELAIATDAGPCSTIGKPIYEEEGGSVVDVAIATLLCLGLHNPQSAGVGGGHFMVIYAVPNGGTEKELVTLDARETAPLAATADLLVNESASSMDGRKAGVPGEMMGYYRAWQRFGRIPWRQLFLPAIRLAREGIVVSSELSRRLTTAQSSVNQLPGFRDVFYHPDGTALSPGELMFRPGLADTLEAVAEAEDGGEVLYREPWASRMAEDVQRCGGIITSEDLQGYDAVFKQPVLTPLPGRNLMVASPRPSSSSVLIPFMLNIMDGYNYTDFPSSPENRSLMYHRLIEADKFAFAHKTRLADEKFLNVNQLLSQLSSPSYAESIRLLINDSFTQPVEYYGGQFGGVEDGGTSHMSILASNGEAVAVTSSVNNLLGCKCLGQNTGILFNDQMTDFDVPGAELGNGLQPSGLNFIEPGKKPLSSMSPLLILDEDRDVIQVIGASGGTKILSSVTMSVFSSLWLRQTMQIAIDAGRYHDILVTGLSYLEDTIDQEVQDGVAARGHVIAKSPEAGVVQGIYRWCLDKDAKCIEAVSDARKGGNPDGV